MYKRVNKTSKCVKNCQLFKLVNYFSPTYVIGKSNRFIKLNNPVLQKSKIQISSWKSGCNNVEKCKHFYAPKLYLLKIYLMIPIPHIFLLYYES